MKPISARQIAIPTPQSLRAILGRRKDSSRRVSSISCSAPGPGPLQSASSVTESTSPAVPILLNSRVTSDMSLRCYRSAQRRRAALRFYAGNGRGNGACPASNGCAFVGRRTQSAGGSSVGHHWRRSAEASGSSRHPRFVSRNRVPKTPFLREDKETL
jgi:hypothetical protein